MLLLKDPPKTDMAAGGSSRDSNAAAPVDSTRRSLRMRHQSNLSSSESEAPMSDSDEPPAKVRGSNHDHARQSKSSFPAQKFQVLHRTRSVSAKAAAAAAKVKPRQPQTAAGGTGQARRSMRTRRRTRSSSSASSSRSRSPRKRSSSSSARRVKYEQEAARQRRHQENSRQVEERRIVYVGKILEGTTRADIRKRFEVFGPIDEISVHYRDHG